MEKKNNSGVKSNILSGASSTIGAAAGVIAGSFISQEVQAAELDNVENSDEVIAEPASGQIPTHSQQPELVSETEPTSGPASTPASTPTSTPEPEIEVVGYDTVQNEDGTLMDVVVVSADGQPIAVVDGNRDGIADVMASDLNQNGQLDEGELVDVSGEQIAMQPMREAYLNPDGGNGSEYIASSDTEPDYVNDANVDTFMA